MPHIRGIELRSDHWNYTVSRPPAILFGEPSLLLIFAASRPSIVATDLIDERGQTEPGAEERRAGNALPSATRSDTEIPGTISPNLLR
jgi:hypothetical protein